MYEWNKTFQKIIEIKHLYEKNFGEIPYNNYSDEKTVFHYIVKKLNIEEYSNWLKTIEISVYKDFMLFHYNLMDAIEELWTNGNSLNREARGLVIDFKNEEIVNCPFRKFFNVGEIEETEWDKILEKIKKCKVLEITDKMDGSMQSASFYKDEIILAGSESCNPEVSWRVSNSYEYLEKNENYKEMIKAYPSKTFIFESISGKDPHIVFYPESKYGLYLIGMRDKYTGKESLYKEITEIANKYNVLTTKIESLTLDELWKQKKLFKADEKEGWVISIDGFKVKFKCDDFLKIHKYNITQSLGKLLIMNIADGTLDDFMSSIPKNYKEISLSIIRQINEYKRKEEEIIKNYYEKAPKDTKKDFAMWVSKNVPKEYRGNVMNYYYDRPLNILKSYHGAYKRTKDLGINDVYAILLEQKIET